MIVSPDDKLLVAASEPIPEPPKPPNTQIIAFVIQMRSTDEQPRAAPWGL
jgi:hypothetical protein